MVIILIICSLLAGITLGYSQFIHKVYTEAKLLLAKFILSLPEDLSRRVNKYVYQVPESDVTRGINQVRDMYELTPVFNQMLTFIGLLVVVSFIIIQLS